MKLQKICIFLLGMNLFSSCLNDGNDTLVLSEPVQIVDVNNPDALFNAINIGNGSKVNGNLPASTCGTSYLSSSISSVSVNSGQKISLPIIYNSGSSVQTVYLQIVGVDGKYYSATPTIVQGTGGFSYLSISLPKGVTNGTFTIQYKVKDQSGCVSNLVSTVVKVTDEVASCANSYTTGSSGLTFTPLQLGNNAGRVVISYDTYGVPDRIDVYQGETWVTGTGTDPHSPIPPLCDCNVATAGNGFVGKKSTLQFNYDPKNGKNIIVVVSGCLNGGTSWQWTLSESPECK